MHLAFYKVTARAGMAIHFILQNMMNKIFTKLKCFAFKIERKLFFIQCMFSLGKSLFQGTV